MKKIFIRKIGGSLYTVIPQYITDKMKLKEGDEVKHDYKRGQIIIKKVEGD